MKSMQSNFSVFFNYFFFVPSNVFFFSVWSHGLGFSPPFKRARVSSRPFSRWGRAGESRGVPRLAAERKFQGTGSEEGRLGLRGVTCWGCGGGGGACCFLAPNTFFFFFSQVLGWVVKVLLGSKKGQEGGVHTGFGIVTQLWWAKMLL